MKEDIYVLEGVIFKENKMLIPQALRSSVVELLHEGHQGVNGMAANARERLFWPGLDAHLRLAKSQCHNCNEMAPSQAREPMAEPPDPEFPFEQVVIDFFELNGNDYMLYADRYSGWVEGALMHR